MFRTLWSRSRWAFCASLLILTTGMLACGGGDAGNAQQAGGPGGMMGGMGGMGSMGAAIPVEARPIDRGDISVALLTYTTIEAERHVDVISRTQGLVKTIYVEEGAWVEEGQALAQLDEAALKLQLQEREVNLKSLQATLERAQDLRTKELISNEEFEKTRFNVEAARAQYETAKLNFEYATIRSPFTGIITDRMIEVGNLVNANQAVFRTADFDPLLARIFVPERQIRSVKLGQTVRINIEGSEATYAGRVRMISPVVDPASGTVKVTVEIRDSTRTMRPGMFATVNIITEVHEKALRVEKKALIAESEGTFAFLFKDGTAQKIRLELGESEGDWVEVKGGVSEGDSIITVGQEGLRNGAPVRIAGQPVMASAGGQGGGAWNGEGGQAQGGPGGGKGMQGGQAGGPGGGQGMQGGQAGNPVGGQAMQGGQAGNPGGGQGMRGGPGGGMDLEQMKTRMFQNPEIKSEYEKRAKEDPDFEKNEEKQRLFFREMFQKMRGGGGGGGFRPQ